MPPAHLQSQCCGKKRNGLDAIGFTFGLEDSLGSFANAFTSECWESGAKSGIDHALQYRSAKPQPQCHAPCWFGRVDRGHAFRSLFITTCHGLQRALESRHLHRQQLCGRFLASSSRSNQRVILHICKTFINLQEDPLVMQDEPSWRVANILQSLSSAGGYVLVFLENGEGVPGRRQPVAALCGSARVGR